MQHIPNDFDLYESMLFRPDWMWKLPSSHRWDYAKRFEQQVARILTNQVHGNVIGFTEGYNATYDFSINSQYLDGDFDLEDDYDVYIEVKSSTKSHVFLEVGRGESTQSGLSATISDFYAQFSINKRHDGTGSVAKFRLHPTHTLFDLYQLQAQQGKSMSYEPSPYSPGSTGCWVDGYDNPSHVWIADFDAPLVDNQYAIDLNSPIRWGNETHKFASHYRHMVKHKLRLRDYQNGNQ